MNYLRISTPCYPQLVTKTKRETIIKLLYDNLVGIELLYSNLNKPKFMNFEVTKTPWDFEVARVPWDIVLCKESHLKKFDARSRCLEGG